MSDLLQFPQTDEDDVAIELDEPTIELEPQEPESQVPTAPVPSVPVETSALMEILPADFKLPALIKFIPNPQFRIDADQAAAYALKVEVQGPEGLQRADLALTALRATLKAIDDHLEEPIGIANGLHKRLTGVRSEWRASGDAAMKTVGSRVYAEQRRLEQLAAEERRKAQEEADRQAKEAAKREAEAAAKAQAPAPVVQELQRQAETATAPPVAAPLSTPAPLRGSTTVVTWKARLIGTPGSDEPNPDVEALTTAQRHQVFALLKAILEGKAPLAAIQLNWSYLNKRAKADKSTLAIAGIEAFDEGGVRAKSSRVK